MMVDGTGSYRILEPWHVSQPHICSPIEADSLRVKQLYEESHE